MSTCGIILNYSYSARLGHAVPSIRAVAPTKPRNVMPVIGQRPRMRGTSRCRSASTSRRITSRKCDAFASHDKIGWESKLRRVRTQK